MNKIISLSDQLNDQNSYFLLAVLNQAGLSHQSTNFLKEAIRFLSASEIMALMLTSHLARGLVFSLVFKSIHRTHNQYCLQLSRENEKRYLIQEMGVSCDITTLAQGMVRWGDVTTAVDLGMRYIPTDRLSALIHTLIRRQYYEEANELSEQLVDHYYLMFIVMSFFEKDNITLAVKVAERIEDLSVIGKIANYIFKKFGRDQAMNFAQSIKNTGHLTFVSPRNW